jgi:hypothetical protein
MAALGSPDRVLMYLVKSIVRTFQRAGSSNWQRTRAFVTSDNVLDPFIGCPLVKLRYKFDSNGRSIKGWDVVPFTSLLPARAYAQSFPHNHPVTIRVNPKSVEETHFFERDQKGGVPAT